MIIFRGWILLGLAAISPWTLAAQNPPQSQGSSRYTFSWPTPSRDRRAVLAMAGNFHMSFGGDGNRPRPYQSCGTERIFIDRNEPLFVSLVHILEMSIAGTDGTVGEAFVTKHWRHDWRFEPAEKHYQQTRAHRAEVTNVWSDIWQRAEAMQLTGNSDQTAAFGELFKQVDDFAAGKLRREDAANAIRTALAKQGAR